MPIAHTLILAAAVSAAPSPPVDCSYDAAAMLVLSYEEFDQNIAGGWRALDYRGCRAAAVEVLRLYRNEHRELTDGARSVLLWHEGQVLALMGNYQAAIPRLLAGVPLEDKAGFADYALGTVAFLQRDKPGLIAARKRLASMPKPADWVENITAMVNGQPVTFATSWPPNLNALDGLIRCFERPYSEAYGCSSLKQVDNPPPHASSSTSQ